MNVDWDEMPCYPLVQSRMLSGLAMHVLGYSTRTEHIQSTGIASSETMQDDVGLPAEFVKVIGGG